MNKEILLQVAMQAVKAVPEVVQYLSDATKAELLGYPPIRANYWAEIYDSVEQYLTGNKPVTSFRNKASIAVSEAFTDAVYEGYAQAGAELPLSDDVAAWLSQRIAEERGHIESMFDRLKQEWEGLDWIKEAYARADGYAKTLDMVFQEAKMRGADNATLVFVGDDGAESCPDCQRMQGKRHTIKYILAHNLIPKPGNSTYECNGYNCQHYWMNPKTGEIYGSETKAMKGGEGSGNFDHEGRPGEVGGSAPSGFVNQEGLGGRASGGVVTIGVNEMLYRGGQFLPSTQLAKQSAYEKKKAKEYMNRKQMIANGTYELPPAPNMISIFRGQLTAGYVGMTEGKFDFNKITIPAMEAYIRDYGQGAWDKVINNMMLYNSGTVWVEMTEKELERMYKMPEKK